MRRFNAVPGLPCVVVLTLVVLTLVVAASARAQTKTEPAVAKAPPVQTQPPSDAARRGKIDYLRNCVWCHGRDGDGRGASAHRFDNAATNFAAGVYKCRSTPPGGLPTDDDLRRSIVHGLDGSGMPPFVALGPLQIDDLVETLKHFSARFNQYTPVAPIQVPAETGDNAASVTRGAALYDRLQCATCHGRRGEGGPGGANLRNEDGSPSLVTDFTRRLTLKCGDSPGRLYTTLMTGLDGTPMAAYGEVISPDEAWDLVHYVTSLRR